MNLVFVGHFKEFCFPFWMEEGCVCYAGTGESTPIHQVVILHETTPWQHCFTYVWKGRCDAFFLQKKYRIKVYFLKLKCEVRLMTKYPKLDDDGELSSKGVKLKGENGGFLVMSLYLYLYLNAVVL